MLYILTGDVQIGKTRWLGRLVDDLAVAGVVSYGVIAPGVWEKCGTEEDPRREKIGIDNLLLPQKKIVAFARRRDLARAEGSYDEDSQSAQAQLAWAIDDAAIDAVNAHFDACREFFMTHTQTPLHQRLLVVDELGRLELEHGRGLTAAMAQLDRGPEGCCGHALIVVRDWLIDKALERFTPVWPESTTISPTVESAELVRGTLSVNRT